MKNFKFIALCSIVLAIISSCSEKNIQELTKNDNVIDFERFSLSIEDNTLVFESEETFNECLNYMNEIGDDAFDSFEETIGFTSLRSSERKPVGYEKIEDPMISTVLNPDCEIVIEGFKFKVNLETERTTVSEFGGCIDKSSEIDLTQPLELTWDDNAFEVLRGENINKSYCTSEKEKVKYWYFNEASNGSKGELKAKVCFQRFTFINTLIVKFKSEKWEDLAPDVTIYYQSNSDYNNEDECEYQLRNKDLEGYPIDDEKDIVGSQYSMSERLFNGTRRVKYYDVDVTFSYVVTRKTGQIRPIPNSTGTYIYYYYPMEADTTLTIHCGTRPEV